MLIKNLTSVVQKVEVEDILDDRIYSVYLEPNGVTNLEGVILLHREKLVGIIEIVGIPMMAEVIPNTVVQETPLSENEVESNEEETQSEDTQGEVVPHTPAVNESQFICEVCGAEFASPRGLAAHMTRSHPNA